MMTTLLRRLRSKSKARLNGLNVTVYTRAQCCCCHKALDLLREYQGRHGFAIEEVDVDSDPGRAEKYGLSVPVVAVDGRVRFKGVVNPVLLDRLMVAEVGKRIDP
jgi:predicted thioredoxin/glutaredoxin